MTRRITLTMVAVVAGALVVAGFGSLALIRAQARRDTVRDLRNQAQGVAQLVDDGAAGRVPLPCSRRQYPPPDRLSSALCERRLGAWVRGAWQ